MPRNLRRYHATGRAHFITFSCRSRQKKFTSPAALDLFLQTVERMRVRYNMRIYGYVVMPEHVHLLVSEPDVDSLSKAMHFLKLAFSKSVRLHVAVEGAFWEKRYYDLNIRTYSQFTEKLRYIHRNPVTRGLCRLPGDWPWSSFLHYAERKRLPVEIESQWTAQDREDRTTQHAVTRVFLLPR